MKSIVIVEVEHGETTDPLTHIIHKLGDPVHQAVYGYTLNYSVAVDQPDHITADAISGILNS